MFIVTAQMVKPVNRDDLPKIPNVENLKNGSLLGVEPKSGGALTGPSGFMIESGSNGSAAPASTQPAAPKPTTPAATPSGGTAKAGLPEVSSVPPQASPAPATKVTPNP